MTIKQAITKGMIMLKSNNVESPKLKARLLLQYVLDKPRQYIIVYDNKEIDKQQQWQYFVNIEKLTKGIPLQHITHRQEFMKMDFFVDENVLIPRPDTEILVEEVIKIAKATQCHEFILNCPDGYHTIVGDGGEKLSGGQRQRVWIAMALAQKTDMLFLDEPTTFLDIAHQLDIMQLLVQLNREQGGTIVMVIHDLNHAAMFSDYVVAVRNGIKELEGTPQQVITPEVLRIVFDVESVPFSHPVFHTQLCLPYDLCRHPSKDTL